MAQQASARKSSPRKATPRKAARKRAAPKADAATTIEDAHVNGQVAASPIPNKAIDLAGDVDDPYPEDIPRYAYWPKAGGSPIVFPAFITLQPSRKFLWQLYKMNALVQGFEWMNLAAVPGRIQERVVDLDDVEYEDFWAGWFSQDITNTPQPAPVIEAAGSVLSAGIPGESTP